MLFRVREGDRHQVKYLKVQQRLMVQPRLRLYREQLVIRLELMDQGVLSELGVDIGKVISLRAVEAV